MKQTKIYIYGKHAVEEALLHAPRVVKKIHLAAQMEDKGLRGIIRKSGIPVEPLDQRKATSQVEGGAAHQGIIALVSLGELVVPFEKFFDAFSANPNTALVLLDGVQDPHNLGAVVRSAAAFGAAAVLIPTHKQSPVTGAVIKASAGMAFRVPLVSVENVQQAIAQLKKKGVKVYGLAAKGNTNVSSETFNAPTLFVMGNEAQGISAAAKALCDTTLSISINPRCESLNVATSSAIALFAWSGKHPQALKG